MPRNNQNSNLNADQRERTFYGYHPETNRYTGIQKADRDILANVINKPKHSTKTEPPTYREGYVILYKQDTDSWEQLINHKGKVYYNADGTQGTIANYGEDKPEGTTWERPDLRTLNDKKNIAKSQVVGMSLSLYNFFYEDHDHTRHDHIISKKHFLTPNADGTRSAEQNSLIAKEIELSGETENQYQARINNEYNKKIRLDSIVNGLIIGYKKKIDNADTEEEIETALTELNQKIETEKTAFETWMTDNSITNRVSN